ncbi:MAG: glycoside hydrolase family 3 N-terminal domain-containing protein [Paludibacter sp.]
MKKVIFLFVFSILIFPVFAHQKTIDQRVDSVLKLMTLTEKVGQLNQYSSSWATGPVSPDTTKIQQIKEGKVGSLLNIKGVEKARAMQLEAMKSRLKIPLLFGLDVIHGYRIMFPVPLAESCSWDMDAIELSARIAGEETAASGIHWTFAPMVDITRDPRWGRVMEGAGEDTYLGCAIAKARVKGFQGKGFGNTDAIMACAKHFAAYGAAIGGRDYNSVDISDHTLWEVYLPPFKAAVDAGAATLMNSFNDLSGIPATGNEYLLRDILKNKWGFSGFVVSDWNSMKQMVEHGYSKNMYEAALAGITAGCDMDMENRCYTKYLEQLVKDNKVSIQLVDDAVRRILRKKFEMGLFDDPFRFCNEDREKSVLSNPDHRIKSREVARKSIVLLKNDNNLLPLSVNQKIALIGPLAKSKRDMIGGWSFVWDNNKDVVSQFEGIEKRVGSQNLLYAKGCEVRDSSKTGFDEAIKVANQADIIILSIGENSNMTAEGTSHANIELPGVQEDLVKAIYATGKPVIVLINAGRPLVFNWTADHIPAILYTWWLGSEAGNAIADMLFGDYNPSGKLTMTFPRSVGQIPIYYNHLNTGRPDLESGKFERFVSQYIDLPSSPKFPFGFGLSYTTFKYSDLKLSSNLMNNKSTIEVSFKLTNTGSRDGEEVVQLYLRDLFASVVRPVKELKDFKKVFLKSGESKEIHFIIDNEKLCFYNRKLEWTSEPGDFDLMIGSSSKDIRLKDKFELR